MRTYLVALHVFDQQLRADDRWEHFFTSLRRPHNGGGRLFSRVVHLLIPSLERHARANHFGDGQDRAVEEFLFLRLRMLFVFVPLLRAHTQHALRLQLDPLRRPAVENGRVRIGVPLGDRPAGRVMRVPSGRFGIDLAGAERIADAVLCKAEIRELHIHRLRGKLELVVVVRPGLAESERCDVLCGCEARGAVERE